MTLRGPTQDDVRKLHAEINQIVHQQYLITAAAITMFGVVLAWHMPKHDSMSAPLASPFVLHGSLLLLVLLFLLFMWSDGLNRILKTYAAYLSQQNQSGWEEDWARYRSRFPHFGYAKIQAVVFIVLAVLASTFPVYLYGIRALMREYPRLTVEIGLLLLVYITVVMVRGLRGWPDAGKRAWERWELLASEAEASPPGAAHE